MSVNNEEKEIFEKQLLAAATLAVEKGKLATSTVQRYIGVGYIRAARLIDCLVELGYLSEKKETQKANEALVTRERLNADIARGYFAMPDVDEEDLPSEEAFEGDCEKVEPQIITAAKLAIMEGRVTASFLQRRMVIDYDNAEALVKRLVKLKYITPVKGIRASEVLVTPEKLQEDIANGVLNKDK